MAEMARSPETVPRELERICRKALEKDPTRRCRNGTEMAEELRRWRLGGAQRGFLRRLWVRAS